MIAYDSYNRRGFGIVMGTELVEKFLPGTPAMSHFDIKQSQKSMTTRITRSFKTSTNLPFMEVSFQQAKGVTFLGSEALSLQPTLVLGVTQLGAISGVLHLPSLDSFGIP